MAFKNSFFMNSISLFHEGEINSRGWLTGGHKGSVSGVGFKQSVMLVLFYSYSFGGRIFLIYVIADILQ